MKTEHIAQVDLMGHARFSPWRGRLSDASHRACSSNPACGDEISLELRVTEGRVNDIRFEGRGCFVSQAAASLLCQHVLGQSIEDIVRLPHASLLGVNPGSLEANRQVCATVPYHALQKALGRNQTAATRVSTGQTRPSTDQQRYSHRVPQPEERYHVRQHFTDAREDEGSAGEFLANGVYQLARKSITATATATSAADVLKKTFDAVYCINLDRRPDRWERFRRQIPHDWPFVEIQRVPAIDGQRVPSPDWWRPGRGAWGCYRSHLHLIEQALNAGLNSILLLEDDAVFCEEFTARASAFLRALPNDWGMAYLGGQHLEINHTPPQRVNDLVYRPYNVNRTHAFAVRGEMLARVYQHLCRNDWHRGHHIDHHLGSLHHLRNEPIYCPEQWLVGQDEGKSNISCRVTAKRFWVDAGDLVKTNPEEELFVAVLGLHSSGSSCLAGVLHHLGLHLGNKLTGYYGNNPADNKCGFEAVGLRDICEAAIPFPLTAQKLGSFDLTRRLQNWINQKRREAGNRKTVAAGKYPQLCQLGKPLLEICRERLRVVVAERPIEQSVKSLQRRCPREDPHQIELHQKWLEEGKQWILSQIAPAHRLSVSYETLLREPILQAQRIGKFLEITPSGEQLQAIRQWVNPEKQHVRD